MIKNELIINNFKQLYNTLNRDTLDLELLSNLYHNDIVFEDCFHNISGIQSLFDYFDNLYENVSFIKFEFHSQWINDNSGVLSWTLFYQHPKLNAGKMIQVEGLSQLNFAEGKVVHHRDYFDGGALLYEHIPLLKRIIHFLKNRLA